MALIEIVNLTRTYTVGEVEIRALRGVDLEIEAGEFIAIMGASGSGKSTLMNIIGCLDRPSSGRFLLEGIDVASLDEEALAKIRSRRIGFVFQNFNLLHRTTALENVELPLLYAGFTSGGARRAHQLLRAVGLQGREYNHPNQLSGGEQQRVAIARALVNRPAILLADEPTGNLDSRSSTEIITLIQRFNREQGLTVVLVTHEPDIAASADRTVTFRDGLIVEERINRPHAVAAADPAQEHEEADRGPDEVWSFSRMTLSTAARALARNKMRSALTVLGIFIGVAAVIAMVAVGQGASAAVRDQIRSLGSNLLIVLPGATTANGVRGGYGSNSTLTVADAEAIAAESSGVSAVGYVDRQVAQVVAGARNWSTSITGTTPNYPFIRDWPVARGRGFSEQEEHSAASVCLLGQTVANNLFASDEDPVGSTVRVKNVPMQVVGVLTPKGQSNWGQDQDDVVLIPFTTAERKVLGVAPAAAPPNPTATATPATSAALYASAVRGSVFGAPPKITGVVNQILVKAGDSQLVTPAMDQIKRILHRRHRMPPGEDDDFTVRSLDDIAQVSEGASQVMALLLAAVASISLLVGGVGIMNILLVSVTERTREIGIRMALGARRLHILLQFLVEAVLLSVLGGLAGVALGILASQLISAIARWPTLLSPAAIAGGFAFSAVVGVFFGYYPARKAALLDPIEALRYE